MLSPVSCANCSRMCLVGFGVALKAAFNVSNCFAFIVVLGPLLLAPVTEFLLLPLPLSTSSSLAKRSSVFELLGAGEVSSSLMKSPSMRSSLPELSAALVSGLLAVSQPCNEPLRPMMLLLCSIVSGNFLKSYSQCAGLFM